MSQAIETAHEREQRTWAAMHAAECRAEAVCADRAATHQERWSASWEAECARQQWSDAADYAIAERVAA